MKEYWKKKLITYTIPNCKLYSEVAQIFSGIAAKRSLSLPTIETSNVWLLNYTKWKKSLKGI